MTKQALLAYILGQFVVKQ